MNQPAKTIQTSQATGQPGIEGAPHVDRSAWQAVADQVLRDAMSNSKQYLDESAVPYGGE